MTAPATTTASKSRRALLAGALGGLGAWAASAVGRASPVRAEGENIQVGGEYITATSRTRLRNQDNNEPVFMAESAASGVAILGGSSGSFGVFGQSISSLGVYGQSSTSIGVLGQSFTNDQPASAGVSAGNSTGLLGASGESGVLPPAKPKTGVYGYAAGRGSCGVRGETTGGLGVRGVATTGTALWGDSVSGYALQTVGRLKAEKVSGVATIAAGSKTKTVSPGVDVTSGSFVLLTPKANLGGRDLWFTTNATANTITIRMSKSRSSNTKVAWLLLG